MAAIFIYLYIYYIYKYSAYANVELTGKLACGFQALFANAEQKTCDHLLLLCKRTTACWQGCRYQSRGTTRWLPRNIPASSGRNSDCNTSKTIFLFLTTFLPKIKTWSLKLSIDSIRSILPTRQNISHFLDFQMNMFPWRSWVSIQSLSNFRVKGDQNYLK